MAGTPRDGISVYPMFLSIRLCQQMEHRRCLTNGFEGDRLRGNPSFRLLSSCTHVNLSQPRTGDVLREYSRRSRIVKPEEVAARQSMSF